MSPSSPSPKQNLKIDPFPSPHLEIVPSSEKPILPVAVPVVVAGQGVDDVLSNVELGSPFVCASEIETEEGNKVIHLIKEPIPGSLAAVVADAMADLDEGEESEESNAPKPVVPEQEVAKTPEPALEETVSSEADVSNEVSKATEDAEIGEVVENVVEEGVVENVEVEDVVENAVPEVSEIEVTTSDVSASESFEQEPTTPTVVTSEVAAPESVSVENSEAAPENIAPEVPESQEIAPAASESFPSESIAPEQVAAEQAVPEEPKENGFEPVASPFGAFPTQQASPFAALEEEAVKTAELPAAPTSVFAQPSEYSYFSEIGEKSADSAAEGEDSPATVQSWQPPVAPSATKEKKKAGRFTSIFNQ